MNRRALLLAAACVAVVAVAFLTRSGDRRDAGHPSGGKPAFRPVSAGPSSASGYDNFKLIHARNVFDPDRRPVRPGPPPATPPPAATDYVALTGTFFDGDGKQLAFFSGSRPEYNKILSVRDQIAGATINKITGTNVEVARGGHPITVAVGQTVPFDNSAPTAAPNAAPTTLPNAALPAGPSLLDGPAAAVQASPNASASSKQDEVRRRMEERRRQEQR